MTSDVQMTQELTVLKRVSIIKPNKKKLVDLRWFELVLFSLALSPFAFAQTFQFAQFDVPGAHLTSPFGVNGAGQIVGLYLDSSEVPHGFLRDTDGSYTTIDYPGATFTTAAGINARGEIVGRWTDSDGNTHAYVRTPENTFSSLDPTAPCVVTSLPTVAHGINDAGDIAGRCWDINGNEYGFIRNHVDGTYTILRFPGSLSSDAWALTMGKVGGNAPVPEVLGDYSDATGYVHGLIWSPSGGFTTLDVPGHQTGLRWRNQRGDITGIYGTDDGALHGFLFRQGAVTTVDYPGSVSNAGTLLINDKGLIVGGFDDSNGNEHGFIAVQLRHCCQTAARPSHRSTDLLFCCSAAVRR
jgi:probable HAF family extracellular repeat protein